ncbi:hypothetical protein AKJ44_00495 [candidate division MSBL1 archaeon SCGC-AAA261F17]|uniref:SHSP domain-containing protein n=1 Tax=candidate division MSBL1 archaeon SCGC-AAA261F17 TaxID=1698274 RepID=A0A133V7N6_9EURY|nr:hypothetical protein AKJ44_00495 [candidate division MSBL1 archaeon SCGC-AAA261F17]
MRRGFRLFGEEEPFEERIRDPFEDMVRDLEEGAPSEMEEFIREEDTPRGKVRKYGPFVYGFSYSKRPGEEPEIQEFGNVRPSGRGRIRPAPEGGREPLTEVTDLDGKYEIVVELPGVKRGEVDVSATEDGLRVKTTGERKYRKEVELGEPIDPDKVDANFQYGMLTIDAEKREGGGDRGKKIDVR